VQKANIKKDQLGLVADILIPAFLLRQENQEFEATLGCIGKLSEKKVARRGGGGGLTSHSPGSGVSITC
jgi:hypothetical protein